MTITWPDVSNHNGAMPLRAGTVACFAKSSEGTGYHDAFYAHFEADSARAGVIFGAYHFLRQGDSAAQARFAFSIVGPSVPMMIDFEPEYDASGQPISLPTLADAVAFKDTYRSLGGLIRLNYLPRWYWQQLGSPSLAPLADLALVSSDYEAYSDTGPGWAPYGGLTPQIWQYTDKQPYSGQTVDFNAYRGTPDQLRALLGLASPEADMPMTDADVQKILSYPIPRSGAHEAGTTTLGAMVAWADAHVQGIADQLAAISAKAAAPVDAKALAAAVVAGLTPIVDAALKAASPVDYDYLAVVVEQHLAATLAAPK